MKDIENHMAEKKYKASIKPDKKLYVIPSCALCHTRVIYCWYVVMSYHKCNRCIATSLSLSLSLSLLCLYYSLAFTLWISAEIIHFVILESEKWYIRSHTYAHIKYSSLNATSSFFLCLTRVASDKSRIYTNKLWIK